MYVFTLFRYCYYSRLIHRFSAIFAVFTGSLFVLLAHGHKDQFKLLDSFEIPIGTLIKVVYGGHHVTFGEVLSLSETRNKPSVTWDGASEGERYILIMAGHELSQWFHWVVTDISGSDLTNGNELIEYAPPTPPKGTGPHRYTFLLFKQPGEINLNLPHIKSGYELTNMRQSRDRGGKSAQTIAREYGLGQPVAANMFLAETKR